VNGRAGVLLPFASTRASLLLVGLLGSQLLASGLTLQKGNLVYHRTGPAALDIWARWDAEWYLLIAEKGYDSDAQFLGLPVNYAPGDATGFFPLYPALIRAVTLLGPTSLLAGVVISNLALLGALRLLRDLVRMDFGEEVARATLWVLLAFPTSFFLSAVYSESVMLVTLLGALRAARAGRPWTAGLFGALCALSRPTGILVLIPLLDELVFAVKPPRPGFRWHVPAALALPAVAFLGWMLYCRSLTGSLLPFLTRQERWRGATSGPWRAFLRFLESPRLHDAHHSTIDLVFATALVLSIPFLFLRLRRSYALYATAAILLPLGSSLWSFSRFAAAVFPVHILAATWISRSEGRFAAYLAVALPLAGFFMALFAAWWWVG
jgi:hypothetical protein